MLNSQLSIIKENFRVRNIEVEFFLSLNAVKEKLFTKIKN